MKNYHQKICLVFITLLVLISTVSVSFAEKLNSHNLTENVQTGDEKFDKTFREGRELIDKEDWKQAADKFKSIVCDCREKKYVDAAFYWLAFTYKKQNMYWEMKTAINRLLSNFPNSSWASDARVMKMEQPSSSKSLDKKYKYDYKYDYDKKKNPLDREDEIKLAAFRSLLLSDAKRAAQLAEDIVKPDSKANENFKAQVIRLLFISTENINSLNNLRGILIKSYQNNSSVTFKEAIIFALGKIIDSESINHIFQLYNSESEKNIKYTILQSFPRSKSYSFRSDSSNLQQLAFNKFLEIIKTEQDILLKSTALDRLEDIIYQSAGKQKNEFVRAFLQVYDSSDDENFKVSLIQLLVGYQKNEVIKKLMDIAKNDKSDKLRITAIKALQGSKNPEVIKFLEDLII